MLLCVLSWHSEVPSVWGQARKGEILSGASWHCTFIRKLSSFLPFCYFPVREDVCVHVCAHACSWCMLMSFSFSSFSFRQIFQTGLRWSSTGTTYLKSPIGGSCLWKGPTSSRLDCGLNSNQRKAWTMGVWPGNGFSCCPKRCSTPTMDSLSTLPRKYMDAMGGIFPSPAADTAYWI